MLRSTPGTEEEAAPGAVEIEEEDEDLGEDDDDYYMVRRAGMWRKKKMENHKLTPHLMRALNPFTCRRMSTLTTMRATKTISSMAAATMPSTNQG